MADDAGPMWWSCGYQRDMDLYYLIGLAIV